MMFGVISGDQILTGNQLTGTLESNRGLSVIPITRVVDPSGGDHDAISTALPQALQVTTPV